MRQRREHELGVRKWCVVVREEVHVHTAETRLFATALVRGRERKLQPRVPSDESAELATRVTARAQYSNRDSMHDECILLQHPDVNRDAVASLSQGLG